MSDRAVSAGRDISGIVITGDTYQNVDPQKVSYTLLEIHGVEDGFRKIASNINLKIN